MTTYSQSNKMDQPDTKTDCKTETIQKKTIVITGGTSGIGLALVKQLAPSHRIVVISQRGELQSDLAAEADIELLHTDLSNKEQLERAVDQLLKHYDAIDMLFNNAAVQYTPEFLADDFNYDGIQKEVDTNFTAICHITYLLLPALLRSEQGHIVNINSGLAIAPKRASAVYCATKSALDSFSRSLSYQLEETNVAVSQVFLPLVDTNMALNRSAAKLDADDAATKIWHGIGRGKRVIDIGKVRLLRAIHALMPQLAHQIMKGS